MKCQLEEQYCATYSIGFGFFQTSHAQEHYIPILDVIKLDDVDPTVVMVDPKELGLINAIIPNLDVIK